MRKKSAATKNLPAPTRPTSIFAIWSAEGAGACGPTPAPCRGGFSRPTAACPARRGSIIWRWSNCCSRGATRNCGPFIGSGDLARDLWDPLFVSALNTDPSEASAFLAGAIVRETFAKGGGACRPLVAVEGLSAAFVDPALVFLGAHGAQVRFGAKLRGMDFSADRVVALDFDGEKIRLDADDRVILAVTATIAATLIPGLDAPHEFRAIVNAHFAYPAPQSLPLLTGVIGGASEWLFGFKDRLSVTISAAERFLATPREELAEKIWAEVQAVAGFSAPLPVWQIIKEKRATFAATPAQDRLRPGPATKWRNLRLAGDWTQTGLPATIEGAIRSGVSAAKSG